MPIKTYILFIVLFFSLPSLAQDSIPVTKEKKLLINGYVKDLQIGTFEKGFRNLATGNLIHNRINIKWKASEKLTAAAEFRNRIYWGEEVSRDSAFALRLKNQHELIDLSKLWINAKEVLFHSNIERLYIDYHQQKWNLRFGRQRINWGLTTLWNPNDLFNTYNFLDFDFEERPGADAIKGQYFLKNNANLELAIAASGNDKKSIGALKYAFNKWGYDLQFISGWYKQNITAGLGWAGSIKDAGFKGEVMYFTKNNDSASQLNISLESDYVFKSGWYFNVGFLYNSTGLAKQINNLNELQFNLTPKKLLPVKWGAAIITSHDFSPLLTGTFSCLYAPGVNLVILLPSVKYNISPNFDFDFFWQSYFLQTQNRFEDVSHIGYLRFKWSF